AIQYGDVRAHESERPAVDNEAPRARLHKSGASAVSPIRDRQQNCRARNHSERGEKQTLPVHKKLGTHAAGVLHARRRVPHRHRGGLVSLTNPMMAQIAPSTMKTFKNAPN